MYDIKTFNSDLNLLLADPVILSEPLGYMKNHHQNYTLYISQPESAYQTLGVYMDDHSMPSVKRRKKDSMKDSTPMLSIDDQKIQPSTHWPMLVKVNVPQPQALLLSGRRRWSVYINTLKVGKGGLLSYSLAWTEVTWTTSH